jgi:hypothetical protein
MAALPKVLSNHADIKSAGGVALRVRTQGLTSVDLLKIAHFSRENYDNI